MSLIFRAYDDGVAYRYQIHGTGKDTVMGELSAFSRSRRLERLVRPVCLPELRVVL